MQFKEEADDDLKALQKTSFDIKVSAQTERHAHYVIWNMFFRFS